MTKTTLLLLVTATLTLLPGLATAADAPPPAAAADAAAGSCEGYGPQTPRDIDNPAGTNLRRIAMAPPAAEMNLCNIHFHLSAEHKAKDFSVHTGTGHGGNGYQCQISSTLSAAERAPTKGDICRGLKPGDTVEVHWVHSSCDVKPGAGLAACVSPACANPNLRVEAQVFTLVNDASAPKISDYGYGGSKSGAYHQAKAIPADTGKPVQFAGSTTGPSYTEQKCSPLMVSWSVRPQCAKLDINSVGEWCKNNVFKEDHAHGVRKLVVDTKLLAPIQ